MIFLKEHQKSVKREAKVATFEFFVRYFVTYLGSYFHEL